MIGNLQKESTRRNPDPVAADRGLPTGGRLRICFLIDSMKADAGTERLVPALASGLDRTRFEPHVCCFEDSPRLAVLARQMPVGLFPLTRVHSPAGLKQAWRFRRYLKRNHIDLLHSFMPKSDIFGVLSSMGLRSVAVVTSRLNTGYWYTPRLVRLYRILNSSTTRILTNSEIAKQVVLDVERAPAGKITVWYPGVDLTRYGRSAGDPHAALALGIPEARLVVGIVANYREVKDLPLFLRAAGKVAAAIPESVFLLVGSGELKAELERLTMSLGLAGRVFFSDGRGAVPDYLARMSVACLSSKSEGLPNAILEYMAAGLPVVATDVGGNAELIEDGKNGFLVRSRDPEAFAHPIIELLRNHELRERMGQGGLARAQARFDLAGAVRRLEDFYRSTAAEARGA